MPDDKVTDLTVVILRDIRDEIRELRGDVGGLRGDIGGLREEMHDLRGEVHTGFSTLGKRIDNVMLGEHQREHGDLRERVTRIEQHLGLDRNR